MTIYLIFSLYFTIFTLTLHFHNYHLKKVIQTASDKCSIQFRSKASRKHNFDQKQREKNFGHNVSPKCKWWYPEQLQRLLEHLCLVDVEKYFQSNPKHLRNNESGAEFWKADDFTLYWRPNCVWQSGKLMRLGVTNWIVVEINLKSKFDHRL